ncbi:UDP-N-acetylmuramoyl-tripeptide--D-alanyl-D-alanine ligase [Parabacteroides sp. PF5-5]|uniref:UDP-N-acetylmuramoyl-tripeptide--D-alanyl-D- alanine ligase n=1 Tax=unclassified Parabacteroides TaxID=2649774 RepID=UPI002474550A|nr:MULTISPECIES: UDP-N-acetylmuramoyl-tripeptide--D-alanyl-D-alanine ligase [unclassified Parabacteroides]MDH6305052.1 UDP-N-acetylmuramoyl-tripeptide--D-alanyl-D-alanine ligase [Parabacteroides sp. PH5-39]MDH6315863.1 UDP-N-acetylmuramoyl-tripeptide--D-alanyl-D-alanine ligase [Parabacteroides sp. PF5-13]MDH6319520.1 UDP-N-acetylmuramoyl-tripeptide--D-alanyl-D-alanine ligase [Parabacteroides sp. PH5-13]MDH6323251.1 UDP-N-acetylmuramoyl-tripeptide--D-alanyl-D-alanine ligase [Parabacteroides sp. 
MTISDLYQVYLRHPQITTDSRNCPKGSLFFALKGEKFDGNQFAEKALAIGSDYAVIDNPDYYKGERTILVDDVLKTLQQLAQRHRKLLGIPVIGITGTNGKTTTKELVATVLSSKFNLLYTQGNLNNHIGVPLTLLRLDHDHELAVIEMGASHVGDIKELAEIAQPNYGIITNVGHAHLEGFGSFENIVKTKGELYDYIRRTKGVIFIKKEDKELQAIAKGIEQVTYGTSEDAFASGLVVSNTPVLTFNWKQQGKIHTVETQLIGDYNLDNVLAAVAVGRYFKIPAERISRAIAAYEPTNNRSQLKKTEKNDLIIDAYNANPDSMKAALDNFAAMEVSPKAIILGDMKELGADSEALHAKIIEKVKAGKFEKVFLCGDCFSKTGKGFEVYRTTDELIAALQATPLEGYHILLKGSRGMALEKVADIL